MVLLCSNVFRAHVQSCDMYVDSVLTFPEPDFCYANAYSVVVLKVFGRFTLNRICEL